jgi:hypothetical protein
MTVNKVPEPVKGSAAEAALVKAACDLYDAAALAQDLIDEADRNGWGKDDLGEDWPEDRAGKTVRALSRALRATQKAFELGDYLDDEGTGPREAAG